ncbi:hypothetical protein ACFL0Y_04740 [Patescibacteria group bacterium]
MPADSQDSFKDYHLAQELKASPSKVIKYLVKKIGDEVEEGEIIAVKKSFSRKRLFLSPVNGTLDSVTKKGILRIKLPKPKKEEEPAFSHSGPVKEIKAQWGIGQLASGTLSCLEENDLFFGLDKSHQDQVVALAGKLSRGFWHKARTLGVKAIICGRLPDKDFNQELKGEFILVNGQKKDLFIPLVVLGNKKNIEPEIWQMLKDHQGKEIGLNPSQKMVSLFL